MHDRVLAQEVHAKEERRAEIARERFEEAAAVPCAAHGHSPHGAASLPGSTPPPQPPRIHDDESSIAQDSSGLSLWWRVVLLSALFPGHQQRESLFPFAPLCSTILPPWYVSTTAIKCSSARSAGLPRYGPCTAIVPTSHPLPCRILVGATSRSQDSSGIQ